MKLNKEMHLSIDTLVAWHQYKKALYCIYKDEAAKEKIACY